MQLSTGIADLHVHTTASDGTDTVEDRLAQARDRDLAVIAITDHETIPESVSNRVEQRSGVNLVSGVEVRADVSGTKTELLGYFVDPTDSTLQSMLDKARSYRHDRNRALVDRLNDVTELGLTYESLLAEFDGYVGRPHIATRLVGEGLVDSIGAAFEQYLGEDGAAFVPMDRLASEEVLETIRAAGGVSSLAHPGRIRSDTVPAIVETLAGGGLDGIEVWYPYSADHTTSGAVGVDEAATLAERHDLVKTGGSDCHGTGSGKFRIGDVRMPRSAVGELQSRRPDS